MKPLLTFVTALFLGGAAAQAQSFDPTIYHRLSSEFRGQNMPLDVINGGPRNNFTHLAGAADVSGQFWHVIPAEDGHYRLTTMFRGDAMCLDVVNGGPRNNQTQLTPCGNFSGQLWRITNAGADRYRLTTMFRGGNFCLDVVNGGADRWLERWRL